MGYGDHWQRARDAAHGVVRGLGADDRATLVLFASNAEENMRATSDRTRLEARHRRGEGRLRRTRFGPALKLADSILSRSSLKRREAVLISDFQKSGWGGAEDARFPEGMTLTHDLGRLADDRQSLGPVGDVRALGVLGPGTRHGDGRRQQQGRRAGDERAGGRCRWTATSSKPKRATVAPHASASVTFAPFTLAEANVRGFDPRRHRCAAGGQHVSLRRLAERAGVARHRRERRPRPTRACS